MHVLPLMLVFVPVSAPPTADVQFFESKVRPLLVEHCQKCHSTKAKKHKGGLLLDSQAALLKGGDSGPAVVPGQPDKSLVIKAVRQTDSTLQMPPSSKLSDRDIGILEEWVRRGAPFPDAVATTETARPTVDLAKGRQFWSFQPPRQTAPPATKDRNWPRQRIDSFVLAELEQHDLAPSPPAAPRTLIRRLSFDLTGLPPTPEEIDAFEKAASRNPQSAIEQLVDRLLASPHYGERWGRFWLDMVRYCDITEVWLESKGQPYHYRDWVVRSLNEDLPYDQFVQRQLAADLLPGLPPQERAALGFLGLSPSYWKELKLAPDVIKTVVAEEWEERIHTLGSTFLGLTAACARCHDHKFDPITQQDYYALAGVLASIRQTDRPLIADDLAAAARQARERVLGLQKEIDKLQAMKPPPTDKDRKTAALQKQIDEIQKTTPHYQTPLVPGVDEASLLVLADGPHRTKLEYRLGVGQDVPMHVRGNPASVGPVAPRRFLAVLSSDPPRPFRQGSGRLDLAKALVTEGAPLASRVIVNRIWMHHFGAGLVSTPSDFGAQGARPSHPALLDDLAARFIANGWSLKKLHREIVLSAAYQQSSAHDARKHASDPDNRWLWRANRRRLEVEAWRDAMLAVTSSLDRKIGGPPAELGEARNVRRTLYGLVKRRELNDLLRLHDFPDPVTHSAARTPTTTPLQQLFTLNSPFMQQQAAALTRRLKAEAGGKIEDRVRHAYLLLYGRPATETQMRLAQTFLGDRPTETLWEQYAAVLLGSNEFAFVD